jgi:hypothetical protein
MSGGEVLVAFADDLFEGFAVDDFDLSALGPPTGDLAIRNPSREI